MNIHQELVLKYKRTLNEYTSKVEIIPCVIKAGNYKVVV